MYWINHELCTGCLVCAEACTTPGALIVRRGKPIIDVALCAECGACAEACAEGAISAVERPVEVVAVQSVPQPKTAATRRSTASSALEKAKQVAEIGLPLLGGLFGAARGASAEGRGRGGHRRRGGGARGGPGQGAGRSW